jgi:hypothetical protein
MAENHPERRFRFRFKTMLGAMTVVALLFALAPMVYERCCYTPLSQAVADLNAYYTAPGAATSAPLVTPSEILKVVRRHLKESDLTPELRRVLKRIDETHLIPPRSRLQLRFSGTVGIHVYLDIPDANYILSVSDSSGWYY